MLSTTIMTQKSYPELNISDRVLLSTGPTNVHPRVLRALSTPVIGYSETEFFPVVDGIASMLGEVFQSYYALNMALPTTGSGGIEAGVASLIEPRRDRIGHSLMRFGRRNLMLALGRRHCSGR